jgi:DMSO/TMAO reductase YedYZ molybdopterin-dependent catalytic subunit
MADWERLIKAKTALAQRGSSLLKSTAKKVSDHNDIKSRVPPGQTLVKNFPVLDMGIKPHITTQAWQLRIFGLVEQEINLDWVAFQALPQVEQVSDFHCVTRWSQLDMDWQGVLVEHILSLAVPLENAHFVTLYGYDGYTTNLPLSALLDEDVLVAHSALGNPLTIEHGGPARLIVPKRYAWKGAKWIKAIELHTHDKPGFWEVRGYHNDAFPFEEQRFSDDD